MRISEWSSDVCSSDLAQAHGFHQPEGRANRRHCPAHLQSDDQEGLPACPPVFTQRNERQLFWRLRLDRRWAEGTRCQYRLGRSEEHTSELQSLMRISYAVFCLKKKKHESMTKPTLLYTSNIVNTHTQKLYTHNFY